MKNIFLLLPFVVGICTVMQGVVNKRIAGEWGLSWALMWNSVICLILAGVMLWGPWFSGPWYSGKLNLATMKWWHFLPGIFGFIIILCIPISISKLGALNSFLILVTSQLLVSGLWDHFVEGINVSWTRATGACLAIVGAWLATK